MPSPDNRVVRDVQSVETYNASDKQKAAAKLSRIPVKVEAGEVLKKPDWIRVKAGSPSTRFYEIKDVLRANKLVTVCEEASCDWGQKRHTTLPILRCRPRTPRPIGCE
jgi:lipoyl synthase